MCSLELPKTVIKQIDKFRKNCLWQGGEINARKPPKAAWKMVCVAKKDGGLGVLDIEKQNQALMLKNLHKFFNRMDIPWVGLVWEKHYANGKLPSHIRKGSFWWRDSLKLLQKFKDCTSVVIEDGKSCFFWTDNWCHQTPASLAPELFSFAKNKSVSVERAMLGNISPDLFHLPVSQIALEQMHLLQSRLHHINLSDGKDRWIYTWGSNQFSSSRMYKELVEHPVPHPAFKWFWKCPCQPKHKVFFWLLLKDRLSTRNILRRRNMAMDSYDCVLCNMPTEECLDHLFLTCDFAKQCWNLLGINIHQSDSFPDVVSSFRDKLQSEFFMVAVILLCWSIWTARNGWIFKNMHPSIQNCKQSFLTELRLVLHRIKPSALPRFELWMHSISALLA
jgi:hypothetical protein